MSTSLASLNLDQSYPVEDSYHESNTSGTIRYLDGTDANGLQAMQRYMGDAAHRCFLVEDKINELVSAFNSNPYLKSFDNSVYSLTDGTHPYTAPVSGVAPTEDSHLTTRLYVTTSLATYQSQLNGLSAEVASLAEHIPVIRKSGWTAWTWTAGAKQHVAFSLTPTASGEELCDIVLISLLERINIGTEEEPNYVYQQYVPGLSTNFKIDAMWVAEDSPNTLNVLIPNDVFYPDGYPESSGYSDITNPEATREFRATVMSVPGTCD